MQEIILILSSLAGVATAAVVRKMPKNKNQLLSLGASSHIKSQVNLLKIEKDILTKTISRLYQADSEFTKIQKDKLLLKYQHQLGIVLAKLEKLEQAANHPDLGPVGDGLITLMDQKLSKLDDRLYELSSKMTTVKDETSKNKELEIKQKPSKVFNFDKPKQKTDLIEIPTTKPKRPFELTTLTDISGKKPKSSLFEEIKQVTKPMPQSKVTQTELINPKQEIDFGTIQSTLIGTKTGFDNNKKIAKISEHKALPEPIKEKLDTLDDDADDLDEIKGKIMKVLSKLDQAEVE